MTGIQWAERSGSVNGLDMDDEREWQVGIVPRIVVPNPGWMRSCVQNEDWSRREKLGAGIEEWGDVGLNLDL